MEDRGRPVSAAGVRSIVLERDVFRGVHDYGELAAALGVDPVAARAYACDAIEAMLPQSLPAPPREARLRIIDYLFREQTPRERSRTRLWLAESPDDCEWAQQARLSLSLVTQSSLPPVPDPVAGEVEITRAVAEEAEPPAPVVPVEPAVSLLDDEPPAVPYPASRGRERRPLAVAVALLALFACAVAIVVILLGGSARSRTPTTSHARHHVTVRHRGSVRLSDAAQTLERLTLSPAGSQPNATGAVAVVRQRGKVLLLVQGRGLRPNDHDYYAVWLYNSSVDNRLLGLVSPPVGNAGTFSSGTTLPDVAVRFHELLVTLQRSQSPARPGPAVLKSHISVQ
jgi:hypothetical protein